MYKKIINKLKGLNKYLKGLNKYLKVFIILNIFDIILTYIALKHSDETGVNELNPLYYLLFDLFGILGVLLIIKIIGIILIIIMFNYIYKKDAPLMTKGIIFINIMYVLIVLNNTYQNIRYI